MNPQTFFDHFDRLTDAPGSVARLRELILQLAVQGKLVPQDKRDEPAARLLKRIEAERKRLVKEKKIREAKPLPPVSDDEKPFEIPDSWEWVRLGKIGDWGAGATPDRKNPDYYGGSTFWFKSGELNDGYISESEETITDLALQKCSLRLNQPGDVLIAMYGATIGKVAIIEREATTNQAVCACTCFAGVYNRFLFLLLKAYKSRFTNQGAGGAQPNISREKIIYAVAPLPPLEEQKRIVAKVDQLMRLCDELERAQAERRESRQRLNRAALDQLLAARDAAEFQSRWQVVSDQFPTLTATPNQIGNLRQTVLQLAMQGKLTRQDPQDEPAPALLRRIRNERERLVKEKKIKRADPLPPVNPDETTFALPSGWAWCRLGDLLKISSGDFLPSHKMVKDSDVPVYGGNGVAGYHNLYNVTKPTLVIGRVGFYCGSVHITPEIAWVTDNAFVTYFSESNLDLQFLYWLLKFINPLMRNNATAQPVISGTKVYPIVIALPPLEEQKRIVTAVNRLMALCDELEAGLRRAEEDGERLLRAAVRSLLAPALDDSLRVPALA